MNAAAATPPGVPDVRASLRVVGYLAASWLLLLVVGYLTLRTGDALGASNRVSFDRAMFVSANVGTLAGFSLDFAKPDDFAAPVRAVFVMQTLSGTLLALAGGGILWARLLGRRHSDAVLTLVAILMIVLAAVAGCLTWQSGEPLATAAVRGVTALGNGGTLFGNTLASALPLRLVLVPLGVLGSLGVVVVTDLLGWFGRRPVSIGHVGRVLTLAAGVYLVGVAWMTLVQLAHGVPVTAALPTADLTVWSARGWGLANAVRADWPAAMWVAFVAIAVVGTGSAGSASAMSLGWLVTAPRRLHAVVINGLYAQAILASLCLAALARFDTTLGRDRRLLVVLSAVMNLGTSHEPLSITRVGLVVLSITLIAAKLLPLGLFALALRPKGNA